LDKRLQAAVTDDVATIEARNSLSIERLPDLSRLTSEMGHSLQKCDVRVESVCPPIATT
jgi:hypothetical protein